MADIYLSVIKPNESRTALGGYGKKGTSVPRELAWWHTSYENALTHLNQWLKENSQWMSHYKKHTIYKVCVCETHEFEIVTTEILQKVE